MAGGSLPKLLQLHSLSIAAMADDGLDIAVVARNAGRHSAERQDACARDATHPIQQILIVDTITILLYKKA